MIAVLADARDWVREATVMNSIDEAPYVDLWPSSSGSAEISPKYVKADALS